MIAEFLSYNYEWNEKRRLSRKELSVKFELWVDQYFRIVDNPSPET